jgi:hypothetical protein
MKSKKDFFIVMPYSMASVYFDTLIPFIVCLKKYGYCNITCIFFKNSDVDQLIQMPFFYDLVEKHATIFNFQKNTFFQKIQVISKILTNALLRKLKIITMGKASANRAMSMMMKFLNGSYYVLPAYNTPIPMKHLENYYYKGVNNPTIRKIFGKNPKGRFSSYLNNNVRGKILLQSQFDEERSDFYGYMNEKLYMGCTKAYPAWEDEVNSSECISNRAIQNADSYIVIVGYKPSIYFYDRLDVYAELLKETIDRLRKFYPEILIVIKLKAFTDSDINDWMYQFVDEYNDNNLVIDYTPLSLLVKKAILGVLNQDTSAFFDFMIQNVPCIEYAKYGKYYHLVNPNGSFLEGLGAATSVKNIGEFDKEILKVKNGEFTAINRDEVMDKFNYQNDKSIFIEM